MVVNMTWQHYYYGESLVKHVHTEMFVAHCEFNVQS